MRKLAGCQLWHVSAHTPPPLVSTEMPLVSSVGLTQCATSGQASALFRAQSEAGAAVEGPI